jgi:deoxyribodipyrimidine photo-lyase
MPATIVWFRQDLRLQDNEALAAALARGAPIVPVYLLDEASEGRWPLGAASRSWLHHSLSSLDAALRDRGSRLILARGDAVEMLVRLARTTGADCVYSTRRYEPSARRDDAIAAALRAENVDFSVHGDAVLFEPETVRNRSGGPFQVFSPFWRACLERPVPRPLPPTRTPLPAPKRWPASLSLDDLRLRPARGWDREFYPLWQPGEVGAQLQLRTFVARRLGAYSEQRDLPAAEGTSRLSPHLHFGEVSPRQVWHAVRDACTDGGSPILTAGATKFLAEIGWREFAYHVLTHHPRTPEQPLRPDFARFPWAKDPGGRHWRAWTRGQTGYPLIDAGMRQLWRTGWMHNRVRMVVASFLVKHLRLPWTEGAAYFWDTLVDADLANNTLNWQWSAGCGADAAPYFRIFAPVTQSEKFDPQGHYIRQWVPELARVPTCAVHAPWEWPTEVAAAGVTLGRDYPFPIVDHATARAEALAAFRSLRA